MLKKTPTDRPKLEHVEKHPFLWKVSDLFAKASEVLRLVLDLKDEHGFDVDSDTFRGQPISRAASALQALLQNWTNNLVSRYQTPHTHQDS